MHGAAALDRAKSHPVAVLLWVSLVISGCPGHPQVITNAAQTSEEECFDEPDDSCRGECFSRQRSYECLERDGAGVCVTECGSRDLNGECEWGIECQQWEGEGNARRCLRRLPMGCAPER